MQFIAVQDLRVNSKAGLVGNNFADFQSLGLQPFVRSAHCFQFSKPLTRRISSSLDWPSKQSLWSTASLSCPEHKVHAVMATRDMVVQKLMSAHVPYLDLTGDTGFQFLYPCSKVMDICCQSV